MIPQHRCLNRRCLLLPLLQYRIAMDTKGKAERERDKSQKTEGKSKK
jgi:hypothetical protein